MNSIDGNLISCLESPISYTLPDVGVVTRCEHWFDKAELMQWLNRDASCPYCRRPINVCRQRINGVRTVIRAEIREAHPMNEVLRRYKLLDELSQVIQDSKHPPASEIENLCCHIYLNAFSKTDDNHFFSCLRGFKNIETLSNETVEEGARHYIQQLATRIPARFHQGQARVEKIIGEAFSWANNRNNQFEGMLSPADLRHIGAIEQAAHFD